MSIRAIVFDFGNVVGFFDHARGIRKLQQHVKIELDDLKRALLEHDLEDAYESGKITTPEFFDQLRQSAGFQCSDEILRDCLSSIFWRNDEVCDLIPELAKDYPLYLLSNTCEIHADRFRQDFADVFEQFRGLALSHEVGHRKPKPEIYRHVQSLSGYAAEEHLFIDDLESNVQGAKDCGWQGLTYNKQQPLRRQLQLLRSE